MTDDLVKRLRERVAMTDKPWATCPALCTEAADRIEQLEAALRRAENGLSVALMWSDDGGTWVAHEIVVKARDSARAALAGEKKDAPT